MPTNNCISILDSQIENATLSLKRLSLRRELQEVREQRQAANEHHASIVRNHMELASSVQKRLDTMLHGKSNMRDYVSAVEAMYDDVPPQYVVRQHAELVKIVRSQEILETFIRLVEHQHDEIVADLVCAKQEMLSELQHQRDQQKQQARQIQEQMFQRILQTVQKSAHHHEEKSGSSNQRSILQSLILRKASNRMFVM
jgi:hypothetical protein